MMTRKKEKRVLTIACLSVVMAVLAFSFMGCVGTGDVKDMPMEAGITFTYEGAGATIETALPMLQGLCRAGTINAEDCVEAKKAYNEAVAIYKFLGDVAIVAVDTGDDSSYRMMSLRLMKLLTQIQAYGAS